MTSDPGMTASVSLQARRCGTRICPSSFLIPSIIVISQDYSQFLETEDVEMSSFLVFLLIAQILIAFALFAATSWYAYYTQKLAFQQRKSYILNKEIWERQSTPKIWFNLTRLGTAKVHLIAANLGGDVAVDVKTTIVTNLGKLVWKWPCILPKDQIHIDLPDKMSYISNSNNIGTFQIECEYVDSDSRGYKTAQIIESELLGKRAATLCQSSLETDTNQSSQIQERNQESKIDSHR